MSFGLIVQVLIAGLAAGAVYGLVAIGFTLVWRLTSVLQLAYGSMVGGSVFLALLIAAGTGPVTTSNVGTVRYLLAVLVTLIVSAAAGAFLYLAVLKPFLARGSALGWIGATVGVAFAIQGALAASFSREAYPLPDPLPFSRWRPIRLPGGANIQWRTLWVLAIGLSLAGLAGYILTRTRFGSAVSAVASEPIGAQIVGLPVVRLTAVAFAITGVMAAAAGLIGTPTGGAITTQTGLLLGLKAIAAALLARFGAPSRVFAAALLLGAFEAAAVSLHVPGLPSLGLGPAWRDVAPLGLALIVIAFRSAGLMREPTE
jgi:branched-subunit amino acid ABC-type transport system permease component